MAEPRQKKQQTEEEALAPEKAAREAVRDTDPPESAPTFTVERLVTESGAFLGQPTHVAAGALAGVGRKELTLEEAKAAVSAWLKSPVKEA